MIEVRDLVKNHASLRVLDGVSLTVRRGEVAVLVGPSGGGKSTLLRCINGLEPFEQGEVRIEDIVLRSSGPAAGGKDALQRLRRRVGMVFQQFHLFPHLRVLDNVIAGPLWALRQPRDQAEETARSLLERVGLADKVDAWPEQLSGGQQQRVAIARALALKPEAILFDEPTSALDPHLAGEVLRVIADLAREGQTMLVVTHAMRFARRVAQTLHVMYGGRIVESGPPEQIFSRPHHEATRAFLAEGTAD